MTSLDTLRAHLSRLLDWQDAHAGFDTVVEGVPTDLQGTQPGGLPFSAWQLLEHMRITQHDILDFCRNPHYEELSWPRDYWPETAAPPDENAWNRSVEAFRADREALKQLTGDRAVDLFATIPHGSGQTYVREILLVADHNAYHLGQLLLVRRLLGIWPEA
jgi:uncharacterized damage-inducible protein DinB